MAGGLLFGFEQTAHGGDPGQGQHQHAAVGQTSQNGVFDPQDGGLEDLALRNILGGVFSTLQRRNVSCEDHVDAAAHSKHHDDDPDTAQHIY